MLYQVTCCTVACVALLRRMVRALGYVHENCSSSYMIWVVYAESTTAMDQPRGLGQRQAVEGT